MVTVQENEFMTRIGPGTPAGALLRRYWHPICPAAELTEAKPKKRIRMLGEDLVLYRDLSGTVGLVPEHCPHRRASLYYGFVEEDGIRCPYHGWKFDAARQCLEMPFEPKDTPLRGEIARTNYLVEKLAGLYWAYMGPQPAPLLPRWEPLVAKNGMRRIVVLPEIEANWLQIMENSVDATHTYYLHAQMSIALGLKQKGAYHGRPLEGYKFEVVKGEPWAGIRKIRVYGGDNPETELGHPLIFPLALLAPQEKHWVMHFRVPVHDTLTRVIRIQYTPGEDTSNMDWDSPPIVYVPPHKNEKGEYDLSTFTNQDAMAWETEGPIVERPQELLGTSDGGIVLYRRMLMDQIKAVQAGQEPMGVIRDPAVNQQIIIKISDGQARIARKMEKAG
jgi:5,5'-dehydrodivanillate O-demethylase oxygenase subunit